MNSSAHFPPLSGMRLVILTISVSLGIFMNVLDVSIANVAIPALAGDLAVSPDDGTWVITSFAVSQAIMLPITGWLARRFGEVRLFLLSTGLFTIVSFLCGLSLNLPMLIFFRVIQGAVSGPMIPLSQSILLANYPTHRQGFATGVWSMTAVVAPIIGPILGGWIVDNYNWPWIFYINLPVGIASVVLTGTLLAGRETPTTRTPIDAVGLVLLIVGIGSLQVLLDRGNDLDWFHSSVILTLAAISFMSLCFLMVWELTEQHPVIDLSLFSRRNFAIGTSAIALGYLVYFSNIVIFPLWLQTQMGYTPTWAGIAAAPVGILPFFLTPLVGLYMGYFDLRLIVSIGFLIFAATSFQQSQFYVDVGLPQLLEPRFLQGLGISFFFVPLMTMLISGLPPQRIASALGLANFCRLLGGSFGTSISVTWWDRRESFHQTYLVDSINPFNSLNTTFVHQLEALGMQGKAPFAWITNLITNQAFMLATDDIFWLSGCTFMALLFIVWLAKPPFMTIKKGIAMD
jgi:DHA2 family multidrug resistance protein